MERSARNLPDVKTLRASYLNIRDLLGYDTVLMSLDSLQVIEGILAVAPIVTSGAMSLSRKHR